MAEEVPRSGGVVLRFNDQKGFGFIKPDDGGDDLFVHHSDIKSDGYRTLFPGQSVEFYVLLDENKTKAVEVTGPNGSPLDQTRNHNARGAGGGGGGRFGGGPRGGGGGGGECYTCGRVGHMARDCDRGPRGAGGRDGGGYGGARGGGGGNGVCFNCGGIGHMARDCTSARNTGGGGGGGGGCYTCGEHGHLARECPIGTGGGGGRGYDRFGGGGGGGGGGRGYDRYGGGSGSGGGGGGRGGGSCYNCGEPGHYAKDCHNNARE